MTIDKVVLLLELNVNCLEPLIGRVAGMAN